MRSIAQPTDDMNAEIMGSLAIVEGTNQATPWGEMGGPTPKSQTTLPTNMEGFGGKMGTNGRASPS